VVKELEVGMSWALYFTKLLGQIGYPIRREVFA
jgi:hypothetical protein